MWTVETLRFQLKDKERLFCSLLRKHWELFPHKTQDGYEFNFSHFSQHAKSVQFLSICYLVSYLRRTRSFVREFLHTMDWETPGKQLIMSLFFHLHWVVSKSCAQRMRCPHKRLRRQS